MVLQRRSNHTDQAVGVFTNIGNVKKTLFQPTIWGYAPPQTKIEVHVIDKDGNLYTPAAVTSDDNNYWIVKILDFSLGPGYRIEVVNTVISGGTNTITLHDVAFGDVWFCSGQSNMEWRIKSVRNAAAEITTATAYEDIRLLKVRIYLEERVK